MSAFLSRLAQIRNVVVTVGSICLLFGPQSAAALSTNQLHALDIGAYYFNTEISNVCASDTSNANGAVITGNNPRDAFHFFVSNGYTAAGAAGIVGNMMVESTPKIDPTSLNSSNHYGIVQWDTSRTTKMKAFVLAEKKDPATLDGQLDYVLQELKTGYKSTGDYVKVATSAAGAATYFNKHYEISGDTSGKREGFANTVYGLYSGDTAVNSAPTNDCTTSNTVSPACVSAAGNTKILCEAEKYQGIYYRFGGGHQPYKSFIAACPDPANPGKNTPYGGVNGGSPSPCATDCSGLVSIATDAAFGQNFSWTASVRVFDNAWKTISINSVQAGDIVLIDGDHVEIVDHVQGSRIVTFGSHHTGTKTGFTTTSKSYWTDAMRYTGPGSTGN